jgi:hypothetical protein
VLCSPRRLCVLPIVPVGSHLWGQLPIISVLVNNDVFYCSLPMFSNLLRLPLILSPDCSIRCITNKKLAAGIPRNYETVTEFLQVIRTDRFNLSYADHECRLSHVSNKVKSGFSTLNKKFRHFM